MNIVLLAFTLDTAAMALPLKVLHINNTDLAGRRFNGYDLIDDLKPYGVECRQLVLEKKSTSPAVSEILNTRRKKVFHRRLEGYEAANSYSNIIYPWAQDIEHHPWFQAADVVHYHLIHNHVVSTMEFARLTQLKPSVWTWHDPWPLTGHCIHPEQCAGWKHGCQPCPYLDRQFPLKTDTAHTHWKIKYGMASDATITPVVASNYMRSLVCTSPMNNLYDNIELIPFGLKHEEVLNPELQIQSREALGIPCDSFVIFFRCETNYFKGAEYAISALRSWAPSRPVTIVTVGNLELPTIFQEKYGMIQLEWTNSPAEIYQIYNAADVFLMPSIAESFGLMALEAMASGRPVVCFEGTALTEITDAPRCGIAVPNRDSAALADALDHLLKNPDELARRGELSRQIVADRYSHEIYCQSLISLYERTKGQEVIQGE